CSQKCRRAVRFHGQTPLAESRANGISTTDGGSAGPTSLRLQQFYHRIRRLVIPDWDEATGLPREGAADGKTAGMKKAGADQSSAPAAVQARYQTIRLVVVRPDCEARNNPVQTTISEPMIDMIHPEPRKAPSSGWNPKRYEINPPRNDPTMP